MSQDASLEVLVAGRGPVAATLALALARAGVAVGLVGEAPPPPPVGSPSRAFAIAPGAFAAWEALGVAGLAAASQPVVGMAVADGPLGSASARAGGLRAAIRFDADADVSGDGPLAWLVEAAVLAPALDAALVEAAVIDLGGGRVRDLASEGGRAAATLDDGRTLRAALVVGADGRRSAVREMAGIGEQGWRYGQEGVVATVALARPHGGVARQLFLPEGPLAVLPLKGDASGDRASLVWSTSPARAQALVEAPAPLFEALLARALGDALGAMTLVGGRARFPLELRLAKAMTAPRVALAGDAAQTIHPVAGQGLNLGLKDAAALAQTIVEARRLGEDLGGEAVLARYARWRRLDRLTLAASTDAFVRLFSTDAAPPRLARAAAFAAAGARASLRRSLMREAGGLSGEPPRLFQGLAP